MIETNTSDPQTAITEMTQQIVRPNGAQFDFSGVKWSWACRGLSPEELPGKCCLLPDNLPPRIADVVLVRVERVGHHGRIDTQSGGRLRLYKGDYVAGVFGNRYATDVYEGRVRNLERLHLLSGSGLIGTVVSRQRDVSLPTTVSFLGYLANGSGLRVNTRELFFHPLICETPPSLILVVGTGMNTGKTTVTRKILRGLVSHGVKAAGCKLTGTASPRDLREMHSTGPVHAMDFSDCGLPSTSRATPDELLQLLHTMLGHFLLLSFPNALVTRCVWIPGAID